MSLVGTALSATERMTVLTDPMNKPVVSQHVDLWIVQINVLTQCEMAIICQHFKIIFA